MCVVDVRSPKERVREWGGATEGERRASSSEGMWRNWPRYVSEPRTGETPEETLSTLRVLPLLWADTGQAETLSSDLLSHISLRRTGDTSLLHVDILTVRNGDAEEDLHISASVFQNQHRDEPQVAVSCQVSSWSLYHNCISVLKPQPLRVCERDVAANTNVRRGSVPPADSWGRINFSAGINWMNLLAGLWHHSALSDVE